MSRIEDVRGAMNAALKAGDKPRKDALSLLLSALKQKWIDKREELTREEEDAVVLKEIKEAREQIETTPADRTETIAECQNRIRVYEEFAPQMMSADEVRQAIGQALKELGIENPAPKDKGMLMKTLMPRLKGKAEGSLVNKLVAELFA